MISGNSVDYDKESKKYEEHLRNKTITVSELIILLKLYKDAADYYTNRNEPRKNDFLSKYKYTLENTYVVNLMKSNIPR